MSGDCPMRVGRRQAILESDWIAEQPDGVDDVSRSRAEWIAAHSGCLCWAGREEVTVFRSRCCLVVVAVMLGPLSVPASAAPAAVVLPGPARAVQVAPIDYGAASNPEALDELYVGFQGGLARVIPHMQADAGRTPYLGPPTVRVGWMKKPAG